MTAALLFLAWIDAAALALSVLYLMCWFDAGADNTDDVADYAVKWLYWHCWPIIALVRLVRRAVA